MRLGDWMDQRGMTDAAFAETLGVSREYVRLLRADRRTPSPKIKDAIREATGDVVDFMVGME